MKGFWIFLWILYPLLGFAQSEPKELLEQIATNIRMSEGIKASYNAKIGEDGISKGEIYLKGEKFKLEMDGMKTWFDGKTQWTFVEDTEEVNISEPTAEELQSINPYAWLSLYKQGYDVKLVESVRANERNIVMTSTQPRQDMQCIVLTVESSTLIPVRVTMASRGGKEVVVIFITSYDATRQYSDEEFVFPKSQYPDVELVDLR